MKKHLTQNSMDSLIQGIKTIISANRYSLSVDDKVLLKDCITKLEEFKKLNGKNSKPNLELLFEVVKLSLKFFIDDDTFGNLM